MSSITTSYFAVAHCISWAMAYISTGSDYITLASPNRGGCGIPNVIRGQYIDPEKFMGTWYSYLVYFPNIIPESIPINTINYYTSLGRGHFPTTDIPAYIATQEQVFYKQDNDTSCQYLNEACYFTVDGRQIGIYFNRTNTDQPVSIDNSIFWTTDYDSMVFFHSCFIANWDTGVCDYPYLYVNTRKKPQELNSKEKRKIADAVNFHTRSYCLDISDFLPFPWVDALPPCPRNMQDDCFQTILPAFQANLEDTD
ncbi:uncharacterized protein LOC129594813 [Paramacrobiotus metropolitanus]|uniref:uncharacterized protein LOC129594813 n=1 Tax=Paramacrobiotus metropolitanus TaxID=2943436 RepID=UPI002445EBE9|nr:uncharacterized protein LOC129594813 [Paramacrobiotus metropolitanus]